MMILNPFMMYIHYILWLGYYPASNGNPEELISHLLNGRSL